jgi:tetratricopeptide (TPR) repeat protein
MRLRIVLPLLLATLPVMGFTPELGKGKLRQLVKLPTITFQANWSFDPERGFAFGSSEVDNAAQIADIRAELKRDSSDGERYRALARLYAANNESFNASRCWSRAVDCYRHRLESHPEDGVLMAGLGESLQGIGKIQEAESVLRRAVRTSPGKWQCWVALGRFLDSEARRNLEQSSSAAGADEEKPSNGTGDQPASGRVALAQRHLEEAGVCFERAAAVAPDESEVYLRRALHRCLRNALENRMRVAAGEQKEDADVLSNCFSPESLADWQRASRLSPGDYRLMGAAALFEIYTVSSRDGRVKWEEVSWNSLPDKSQRSLHDVITRLENLGQSPEPRVAAGALELLGILQGPVLHEPQRAIANFRRALALDPSREQAWEMLSATLARGGRYQEMLAVCEDRVRLKKSVRSHVLLAKAFERLGQWEDCEENVMAALSDGPNEFALNLAYAALILRRSHDATMLAEANDWLTRAELLASKATSSQRSRQQIIDLALTRSIYFALTDELDAARQWANAVINQDKENKLAREILAAMDY